MALTFEQLPNEVADLKQIVLVLCKKVDQLIAGRPTEKEIMNAKEAADYLGISVGTLYNKSDIIPRYKQGGLNVYKRSELESHRLSNRVKTKEESFSDLEQSMIDNKHRRAKTA